MRATHTHRTALLESAVRLFRKQGYAATGINEILAASAVPKGSLYHYFPGGKAEIGVEALRLAAAKVTSTLAALAAEALGPAELVERYFALLGVWMRESGYRDGSPITTTVLEMAPQDEPIRAAAAEAYSAWAVVLEGAAVAKGMDPARAARLARLSLATLEGALVQCRVARDESPLIEAAAELAALFGSRGPMAQGDS